LRDGNLESSYPNITCRARKYRIYETADNASRERMLSSIETQENWQCSK